MIEFNVRKLHVEDFDKGFLETLSNLSVVDLDSIYAENIYKNIIKNPVYHIFVAEIENQIVGAVTLVLEQKFIHSGGKVCHIEDVVVKKEFEKKGIGSALIRTAIEEAKKQECYKIILGCSEEKISFYERFGFRTDGARMRLDITSTAR